MSPSWAQDRPRWSQQAPKMTPNGFQVGGHEVKMDKIKLKRPSTKNH